MDEDKISKGKKEPILVGDRYFISYNYFMEN